MIALILKSYLTLFISVGSICIVLFVAGLYWIFKDTPTKEVDLSQIAGDDILTTQLDLARAYIESDKKQLAQGILQLVLNHGNSVQKQEARMLMDLM